MRPVAVCVFAKPAIPRRSKTRIGRVVGHELAAELAGALVRDIWGVVSSRPWAVPILATTDTHDRTLGLPEEAVRWDQGEGDLGSRVERILARGVDEHGAAIALGADTAGLRAELLDEARVRLAQGHHVIGPSDDGGFYLMGLTICPPGLLQGLPWSSKRTCQAVEERLEQRLGVAAARLATLFDVDEVEDVERLVALDDPRLESLNVARRILAGRR